MTYKKIKIETKDFILFYFIFERRKNYQKYQGSIEAPNSVGPTE